MSLASPASASDSSSPPMAGMAIPAALPTSIPPLPTSMPSFPHSPKVPVPTSSESVQASVAVSFRQPPQFSKSRSQPVLLTTYGMPPVVAAQTSSSAAVSLDPVQTPSQAEGVTQTMTTFSASVTSSQPSTLQVEGAQTSSAVSTTSTETL